MSDSDTVFINHHLMPRKQAAVPLADRGFRYGDGVFETIRVHSAVPYQWAAHLARLHAGLAAIRILPPCSDAVWQQAARALIQQHALTEGFLRLSVSRGVGGRGYFPAPENFFTLWAMETLAATAAPSAAFTLGVSAYRKIPPQCLPAGHKLAQGLNSTLAAMQAQEAGYDDALQLDIHGHISETSSANIFWVSHGRIFTPSAATGCLLGTTRAAIMRLSPVAVEEVATPLEALHKAEAVWISNVRLGVHPIRQLAPLNLTFNPDHPLIHNLRARLDADRDADATRNAAQWSIAT